MQKIMVLLTWREKTTRLLCDTVARVDKDIVATAHPAKHKSKLISINQYFIKLPFICLVFIFNLLSIFLSQ